MRGEGVRKALLRVWDSSGCLVVCHKSRWHSHTPREAREGATSSPPLAKKSLPKFPPDFAGASLLKFLWACWCKSQGAPDGFRLPRPRPRDGRGPAPRWERTRPQVGEARPAPPTAAVGA